MCSCKLCIGCTCVLANEKRVAVKHLALLVSLRPGLVVYQLLKLTDLQISSRFCLCRVCKAYCWQLDDYDLIYRLIEKLKVLSYTVGKSTRSNLSQVH